MVDVLFYILCKNIFNKTRFPPPPKKIITHKFSELYFCFSGVSTLKFRSAAMFLLLTGNCRVSISYDFR